MSLTVSSGSMFAVRPDPDNWDAMGLMRESLVNSETRKSAHKEGDQLTERERLVLFDEDEVAVLPRVLADDIDFQCKAATVSGAPAHLRQERAEAEARAFAPYKGPHLELITRLLLAAAEFRLDPALACYGGAHAPNGTSEPAPSDRVGGCSLDQLDPRRARKKWPRLEEGAQRVASFGAGRCIGCRGFVHDVYRYGAVGKRGRRKHCLTCSADLSDRVRASHIDAMSAVLDVASEQHRAQRAARRTR